MEDGGSGSDSTGTDSSSGSSFSDSNSSSSNSSDAYAAVVVQQEGSQKGFKGFAKKATLSPPS